MSRGVALSGDMPAVVEEPEPPGRQPQPVGPNGARLIELAKGLIEGAAEVDRLQDEYINVSQRLDLAKAAVKETRSALVRYAVDHGMAPTAVTFGTRAVLLNQSAGVTVAVIYSTYDGLKGEM